MPNCCMGLAPVVYSLYLSGNSSATPNLSISFSCYRTQQDLLSYPLPHPYPGGIGQGLNWGRAGNQGKDQSQVGIPHHFPNPEDTPECISE